MSNILIINFDLVLEQYIPILKNINTMDFKDYSIISNNFILDSNLYKIITNFFNKAIKKNNSDIISFYRTLNSLIPILSDQKNLIITDISYNDINILYQNNINIQRGIWLNGSFSPAISSKVNNINNLLLPSYTIPPVIYDNIFVIGSLDIIPKNLYNYFYLWIDLAANQNNIYYKLLE